MKKTLLVAALLMGPFNQALADMQEAMTAYENGDIATALKEFTILAVKGDPIAQNNLGVLYSNGEFVKQNLGMAAKWYLLAAEQGLAVAQVNMGHFYERGQGVEKDLASAMVWYQLAAEKGDSLAQFQMGRLLAERGAEDDDLNAYTWLTLAIGGGEDASLRKDALDIRRDVAKRMSKALIVESELLVEAWKPQH